MERVAVTFVGSLICLTLETLGNFLLSCQIYFEKYGMNPQKRTITNQFYSGLCFWTIVFNALVFPWIFCKHILKVDIGVFGPLTFYGPLAYLLYLLMTLTQMISIRVLYLYAYPKVAELNEYTVSYWLEVGKCIGIVFIVTLRFLLQNYGIYSKIIIW